jgi:sarcosine oxidase subunit alpha
MSQRIAANVSRPPAVTIYINGKEVSAYEGETLATALIAAGQLAMSSDDSLHAKASRLRAPFCNMGVCFDCMIEIAEAADQPSLRARACLTPVRAGLHITVPSA